MKRSPIVDSRWATMKRLLLVVPAVAATILLFPGVPEQSEYEGFEEGEVAPDDLRAPFDFDVMKPAAQYEAERGRAREDVAAYFRFDDGVLPRALGRLDDFETKLLAAMQGLDRDTLDVLLRIGRLHPDLSERAQRALLKADVRDRVLDATRDFLTTVLQKGLADERSAERIAGTPLHMLLQGQTFSPVELRGTVLTPERANRQAQEFAQTRFSNSAVESEAFRLLVGSYLEPNVRYDRAQTEEIQEDHMALVTPVERRVLKGEIIIDGHKRVSAEGMRALESLREEIRIRKGESDLGWAGSLSGLGRVLITMAILAFCTVYLKLHRPRVYADSRRLLLLSITAVFIFVSAAVVLNVLQRPWLVIPVAAGSMVVSLLIDAQLGVFFTLVSVVIVAINADLGLDFLSASLIGGFTAVYAVKTVRHRYDLFRATLLVSMAYVFSVTAIGMVQGRLEMSLLTDSGWGVLNAFLSVVIAYLLIPVLEVVCQVTTDLRLLELSDLNRPLLKRLMLEAPGTYHHSMVMGTLAEAACEAVGANSLLGRVQCYYHDIGKLNKPEYFVENIAINPRARNPHDRLTPSMSCLILESHVREGVALGQTHKLPEPLLDAIREHHGTSEMSFFLEKARAINPDVDRDDFRYPGPRPQTTETAIVMLADGVEASSRVLNDPRPSRIRNLVTRIIDSRVEAGEMDECDLTLSDLARIREAFVLVLTGMFHGRIRYPAEVDASTPRIEEVRASGAAEAEPQELDVASELDRGRASL